MLMVCHISRPAVQKLGPSKSLFSLRKMRYGALAILNKLGSLLKAGMEAGFGLARTEYLESREDRKKILHFPLKSSCNAQGLGLVSPPPIHGIQPVPALALWAFVEDISISLLVMNK